MDEVGEEEHYVYADVEGERAFVRVDMAEF
jgi:hypothetical protein